VRLVGRRRSYETRGQVEPLSFFFYSYSCFVGNWAVVFDILSVFVPFFLCQVHLHYMITGFALAVYAWVDVIEIRGKE